MGSYCGIHFDQLSICDSRSDVPDDWVGLFQERDRRERTQNHQDAEPDDEQQKVVEYVASRDIILRRLSILGVTEEATRRAFDEWLSRERSTWRRYAKEWATDGENDSWAMQIAEGLGELNYESWCRISSEVLRTRYDFSQRDTLIEGLSPFKKQFYDFDDSYIWFAGYGSHIGIRALLDAASDTSEVRLDISDLIGSGYIGENDPVCTSARGNAPHQIHTLAPTMVMAEGSSDLTALRLGLEALHPDLTDYFSFFNHAELSVDGGAAYLVKFLKAIAAARSTSRILAIFDNDTTGIQAFEQAQSLALPSNFMVTRYPDSNIARAYPTIGPSGPVVLNVNGQAAGIELYLGREALSTGGALRPVRWTGYNHSAGKYQGEVEGKGEVLDSFRKNIATVESVETARASFPDLEHVWQHIFDLVERSRGQDYLRMIDRLKQED